MHGDTVLAKAAGLPQFTANPIDRLRHTVAAFEDTDADEFVVTATMGMPTATGHDRTGLTWGDLRELLALLDPDGQSG